MLVPDALVMLCHCCIPAVCFQVQKLCDQYIAEVDKLRKIKDTELKEHRD